MNTGVHTCTLEYIYESWGSYLYTGVHICILGYIPVHWGTDMLSMYNDLAYTLTLAIDSPRTLSHGGESDGELATSTQKSLQWDSGYNLGECYPGQIRKTRGWTHRCLTGYLHGSWISKWGQDTFFKLLTVLTGSWYASGVAVLLCTERANISERAPAVKVCLRLCDYHFTSSFILAWGSKTGVYTLTKCSCPFSCTTKK